MKRTSVFALLALFRTAVACSIDAILYTPTERIAKVEKYCQEHHGACDEDLRLCLKSGLRGLLSEYILMKQADNVNKLLQSVTPSCEHVEQAIRKDYPVILQRLLACSQGVKGLTVVMGYFFYKLASSIKRTDCLKMMLKEIDPSSLSHDHKVLILSEAAKTNSCALQVLLADGRFDPRLMENGPLFSSLLHSDTKPECLKSIRALLADPRVDALDRHFQMLQMALKNRETAMIFLTESRIDFKNVLQAGICYPFSKGFRQFLNVVANCSSLSDFLNYQKQNQGNAMALETMDDMYLDALVIRYKLFPDIFRYLRSLQLVRSGLSDVELQDADIQEVVYLCKEPLTFAQLKAFIDRFRGLRQHEAFELIPAPLVAEIALNIVLLG